MCSVRAERFRSDKFLQNRSPVRWVFPRPWSGPVTFLQPTPGIVQISDRTCGPNHVQCFFRCLAPGPVSKNDIYALWSLQLLWGLLPDSVSRPETSLDLSCFITPLSSQESVYRSTGLSGARKSPPSVSMLYSLLETPIFNPEDVHKLSYVLALLCDCNSYEPSSHSASQKFVATTNKKSSKTDTLDKTAVSVAWYIGVWYSRKATHVRPRPIRKFKNHGQGPWKPQTSRNYLCGKSKWTSTKNK